MGSTTFKWVKTNPGYSGFRERRYDRPNEVVTELTVNQRTLDSIVAGGSVISGGRVQKSVIGNNVRVNSYSEVSESIIYNHVNIGRHSKIRRAIIDRHVSLPEHTEIGFDLEADKRRFHVTDSGIVIVVRQESLIEEPESA